MGIGKNKSRLAADSALRRSAEEHLKAQAEERSVRTTDKTQRLVHELAVHQIELEMQNSELHRVMEELELSRNSLELIVHERTGELTRVNMQLVQEMDERKQAEEALRESEAKYRMLVENSGEAILFTVLDGNILAANPEACRIFGRSEAEIIRVGRNGLVDVNDTRLPDALEERKKTGRFKGELNFCRKDGTIFPGEITATVFKDSAGNERSSMLIHDISKRKRTEDQIAKLGLLKERLIGTLNLNKKLTIVTDGIVEIFGADFARIWLIQEGNLCKKGCFYAESWEGPNACRNRTRCLHLVASSGRYSQIDGKHRRVPFGCHKIGRIASGEDTGFITNDVIGDPRIHDHEWAQALGLVSFAGFRLISAEGAPIGVLALFSKQAIPPTEEGLMVNLANYVSQVILVDRGREALLESERRFQLFMRHFPGLAYIKNSECRTIFANQGFLIYLGIDPSEIIGKSNHDILPAGLAEKITANDRCVLSSDLSEEHVEYEQVFDEHTWLTRKFAIPMTDNETMLGGISIDITERKLLEEKLHTQSMVDELTGLYNRRGFLTLSEQQLKIAERIKKSIFLLFIDLDYLKWINDTLGHLEGDMALVEIAAILRQTFRTSDIIGRLGGDEFAVLAIDSAHEELKAVPRLRDILNSHNMFGSRTYKLSLSVGIAQYDPENPVSLDELISRADNLMYEEKRTKRH